MDNKIDYIIKDALLYETKELLNADDIFSRIESEIKMNEGKKAKKYKQFSLGFGYKKQISIAACLLIVCTALIFATSNQARAFAYQAIESIKTIFILEKVDSELQLVEKPINEAKLTPAVIGTTHKSDEELSGKLGFNVNFPETLGDSFRLSRKSLGVMLRKQVDMEIYSELEHDMFVAIEDDNVLNELKPYSAIRTVSGTYARSDHSTFIISISRAWRLSEIESQMKEFENLQGLEIQKVTVGDLDGHRIKELYPEYPTISDNGVGKSDIYVKPEIKERYILYWEKSDVVYTLITYENLKLTLEESLKIAEEFMKAN